MPSYADLEIGLHRYDADNYLVEMRFSQPESDADTRLLRENPVLNFDVRALRQHHLDDVAYGQALTQILFGPPQVLAAFNQARSNAQALDVPLRVRLFVGPSAPELLSLRWETLRDPQEDRPLLTSERIIFSRYLSSFDWRPVRLRPQTALRALVVIANPSDLDPTQLAPVDVAGELARAEANLGDIPLTALASEGQATLNQVGRCLREGYDVLYLVCHGALIEGEPHLWLENEAGEADVVVGREWLTRLQELQNRPRLIVLASCQSAGTGEQARSSDEGALAALGPRLAEIGIPAVVAMQGEVMMRTVEEFMPVFFTELQRDGQIDRAMAVARGVVRERADWWMPVLFMRLKSGRLWYKSGFADEQEGDLEKWPALLRNLERGRCTPIIGPGLTESLLGTRRDLAQRWAETYHFPMAPHDREDLPQVAQYLSVNQEYMFPRDELMEYLRRALITRYGDDLLADSQRADLADLLAAVGRLRRERDPDDPHRVLAELNMPIYITTDPSNLLETALRAAGKEPALEICRWNKDIEWLPSIYDDEPDYRPTVERPLVYQLFGRLEEPESLVLTEDDYFDYLIGVTGNKDLIPGIVRRQLVDAALLFLGFRMDDWDFRVLFRSIMSREGGRRRSRYAHIAAQIDPEEGRILEPDRARRYLERYFQGSDINIYWGSAEDFIKDLKQKWEARSS